MKSKDFSSLEGKFFSTKTQFPFVPKINKISRTIEFICLKSIKALKSILKKIISIVNQSDYYCKSYRNTDVLNMKFTG